MQKHVYIYIYIHIYIFIYMNYYPYHVQPLTYSARIHLPYDTIGRIFSFIVQLNILYIDSQGDRKLLQKMLKKI